VLILIEHRLSDDDLIKAIEEAVKNFKGYVPSLESAIGALFVGKGMGWKVLRIVHNEKTIRTYEQRLGLRFEVQMEQTTPLSKKSYGYLFAQKWDSFAKLVRGEVSYAKRSYVKPLASADE
jgi:hypothetical protein